MTAFDLGAAAASKSHPSFMSLFWAKTEGIKGRCVDANVEEFRQNRF
jgi:hypothetical protein